MTTTPVMTITDEQIAEIEALSERNHDYVPVSPAHMQAIISRLRAAEKDASRWRHARNILTVEAIEIAQSDFLNFGLPPSESESVRADISIDAAMEQSE